MKRTAEVATTITAATVLSACSMFSSPEVQTSPNDPTLERIFDETQQYWTENGVGVAATRLVTLREPDDIFYCHNSEDISEHAPKDVLYGKDYESVARFCEGENTVVIFDKVYKDEAESALESDSISASTFAYYIMAHEVGHKVTAAKGEWAPDKLTGEFRADCYAGASMAGMGITEIPQLREGSILTLHAYMDGAKPEQQLAAFDEGYADPTGEACSFYYDESDLIKPN